MNREPDRTMTRQTLYGDLPEYLTPDEFRKYLGLGRNTTYDLIQRGEIPSRRFGRQIRIPKTALLMQAAAEVR